MTVARGTHIAIREVSKEFGPKVALHSVTLDVEPGEFLVLLGPSGSGKTTLLRCLAGIERPTAGEISLNGNVVVGDRSFVSPEKRSLAMVFQDYALWPHLTVSNNVGYPLSRETKETRAQRVSDLLERVGIAYLASRFPNELSGGEQQRVALARALAADVGLILFDEPLSNLDADRRELLRIEIATLTRDAGATAVYITHDQAEAFALADRIGVLNHGKLVQIGAPESIYRNPTNAFVTRFTGIAGEFPAQLREVKSDGTALVSLAFCPDHLVEGRVIGDIHDQLAFFVRAAGVSLSAASDENGIRGAIRDVAFNGRGYEHVVELASTAVLTKVFSSKRFERGENIKVHFDSSASFVTSPDRKQQ